MGHCGTTPVIVNLTGLDLRQRSAGGGETRILGDEILESKVMECGSHHRALD